MNLSHLKYFVDAAKSGSISASAKSNFVTQSAVSRAVAKLEEDLGVTLVLHQQNHFQLSEAGEVVLKRGLEILGGISSLKELAHEHSNSYRGPLRFGCNQAIASKLVGPALAELTSLHPEVIPTVKLGNTDQVQQLVEQFEVDFGIVVQDGEVEKLYRIKSLYEGEFVVVKSPQFKLGNPFEHLIVSRVEKGGLSQHYFKAYRKAYGAEVKPKIVISSWQVIMDFALSGFGCALVPHFLCAEAVASNRLEVVKHRVKPIPFKLCAITSKTRKFPKNAQLLFDLIK